MARSRVISKAVKSYSQKEELKPLYADFIETVISRLERPGCLKASEIKLHLSSLYSPLTVYPTGVHQSKDEYRQLNLHVSKQSQTINRLPLIHVCAWMQKGQGDNNGKTDIFKWLLWKSCQDTVAGNKAVKVKGKALQSSDWKQEIGDMLVGQWLLKHVGVSTYISI